MGKEIKCFFKECSDVQDILNGVGSYIKEHSDLKVVGLVDYPSGEDDEWSIPVTSMGWGVRKTAVYKGILITDEGIIEEVRRQIAWEMIPVERYSEIEENIDIFIEENIDLIDCEISKLRFGKPEVYILFSAC